MMTYVVSALSVVPVKFPVMEVKLGAPVVLMHLRWGQSIIVCFPGAGSYLSGGLTLTRPIKPLIVCMYLLFKKGQSAQKDHIGAKIE